MKDIAIAIPVLGRQYHIDPLLESIHATTPNPRVVFITSTNDDSGVVEYLKQIDQEVMEIESQTIEWKGRTLNFADYGRKINLAFRNTSEPFFFMGGTDIQFMPNWFEIATDAVTDRFQCIGTKDGFNRTVMAGFHSTHTMITREYGELGTIDDPNCVLHEGYWHEYVDVEMIETAAYRDAFFSSDSQVLHVNRQNDFHYSNWWDRNEYSRPLINERRKLWGMEGSRGLGPAYLHA